MSTSEAIQGACAPTNPIKETEDARPPSDAMAELTLGLPAPRMLVETRHILTDRLAAPYAVCGILRRPAWRRGWLA